MNLKLVMQHLFIYFYLFFYERVYMLIKKSFCLIWGKSQIGFNRKSISNLAHHMAMDNNKTVPPGNNTYTWTDTRTKTTVYIDNMQTIEYRYTE